MRPRTGDKQIVRGWILRNRFSKLPQSRSYMEAQAQLEQKRWLKRILIGRNPQRTLARVVIWVALGLLIPKFVLLPVRIQGISMMPTYQDHRINFVNRLAYAFHDPRRGDVVAIKLGGERIMYLKRIVALPGETLEFRGGRLFIDGKRVPEPYVKFPCRWEHGPEKIGLGEYYVVGDNRSMDFADHVQGKAWRSRILGKALL